MDYIFLGAMSCIGQACCWYNVFRCCGCIDEENRHVQIEKQAQPIIVVHSQPKTDTNQNSPNPFLNPNAPKYPPVCG
jgi:hypothetical protein